MRLALALGARGAGTTWPNPFVGCVIVKNGIVLGRGWTQIGGRPHAEPIALAQAAQQAHGATAYVTLEPCAHHGQTPPCAEALIKAGIARVVVATTDPDPRVSGRGISMLRAAGVEVTTDICKSEADHQHAGFFKRIQENRPFVTLKLATTLDGKIATRTGDSQWITGPNSRKYVHLLRSTHDAVMVGRATSTADDPSLTVREFGAIKQPVRIVLDRQLQSSPTGNLGQTAQEIPVWMCHAQGAQTQGWAKTGAELIACASGPAGVDLGDALGKIAARGITRVFCEGGGTLAASLLRHGVVDQLITITAGVAIGAEGIGALGTMEVCALADAPRMKLVQSKSFGGDIISTWHPA
nr:bifunctional diaminohydroxyphosphoribosylaminopyrimidine deaminase/5-amino-6-(5-phosphoribosylamino)uracil reductase RibD [Amylibacter marinus]